MKIKCSTLFDITETGVTGHYKPSRVPFCDASGKDISNEADWLLSRNQQRNWETLLQLISLRTQAENITTSVHDGNRWIFEFEISNDTIFLENGDPLAVLKNDCRGVPMLLGSVHTFLSDENIWFHIINIEPGTE